MGKAFVKLILRRPVTVLLLMLGVVVFGVAAMSGMPLEYMPDIEMPMHLIILPWPGSDADSMDRLVTQPLEDTLGAISGVDSINSYSHDNFTTIQLTYNYGNDMDESHANVKNAIDNLMPELPDDVGEATIVELSAEYMPTMMITAVAPEGTDVAQFLTDTVVPDIESLAEVALVDVSGTRDEYLRIVLDEAALRQYGLSIQTVGAAIAAADFDMPVGSVTLGSQDVSLGVYGSVGTDKDFRNLPLSTPYGKIVRLDEVCSFYGFYQDEADTISRHNGGDSVMLQITKQDSAATVAACRAVETVLDRYSVDGVQFQTIYSEADSIIETLGEVLRTLIISVVLTMAVLFLFFGDWRASVVVAFSMPLSILLAVILLNWAGYAIDLMTGTSLIIAIGMIVDNSIVILESCMRAREQGLELREAAAVGTATMLMSIVAGTLTTVVVYIPLAFAEGMTGMMSAPLSWTILLTMLSSLLCAVTIVPLAFLWLQPRSKEQLPINRLLGRFRAFYRRVMPPLLHHPGRVVFLTLLLFAASLALLATMRFVLIPDNFDGSVTVTATFRSGTKLEVMDEAVEPIEKALIEDRNFNSVSLSLSESSASFTAYAGENCARSSEEAVEYYTNLWNEIPGVDVTVAPTGAMDMSQMMAGDNSKEITLVADSLERLREGANLVEAAVRKVPGVLRVENAFSQSRVKGKLVVDSQRAQAAGTSETAVAMQIYYVLGGMKAASVDYGDREYDVILEFPEGKYEDVTSLLDYPIMTQTGRQIVLRDIASVTYETMLPNILRQEGKYMSTVTATTSAASKYEVADAIEAAVDALELPAGVEEGVGMMDSITDAEIRHITKAMLTGVFLVFLVMAIQFNSPRLSIMVMMCVPLSLIGSIGLVKLTGRPMSLMGLMGFLMLIGIAVNNGIYLIDGTTQLREKMPLGEALIESGTTRLRPILMTTLTTIISMLPMLFSTDSGMGMMKDMGYIMIGGLVASTILAMFLMPAFYLVIRRERFDGTKKGSRT